MRVLGLIASQFSFALRVCVLLLDYLQHRIRLIFLTLRNRILKLLLRLLIDTLRLIPVIVLIHERGVPTLGNLGCTTKIVSPIEKEVKRAQLPRFLEATPPRICANIIIETARSAQLLAAVEFGGVNLV